MHILSHLNSPSLTLTLLLWLLFNALAVGLLVFQRFIIYLFNRFRFETTPEDFVMKVLLSGILNNDNRIQILESAIFKGSIYNLRAYI